MMPYSHFSEPGAGAVQGSELAQVNNGTWSLSETSVGISTWYLTFHFVPVPAPVQCSVNVPYEPLAANLRFKVYGIKNAYDSRTYRRIWTIY